MTELRCDCKSVREPFSFTNMTRCQTPGCDTQVVLPRSRCSRHAAGLETLPPSYEYWEATDGTIATRGFDFEQGCDCE